MREYQSVDHSPFSDEEERAAWAAVLAEYETLREEVAALRLELDPPWLHGWCLPSGDFDGRMFWTATKVGRRYIRRVGRYTATAGGWKGDDGVLMDVTCYWPRPLPQVPGEGVGEVDRVQLA